jgi:hypothetical protein
LTDRDYRSGLLNLQRIEALPAGGPYVAVVGSSKIGCGLVGDRQATRLLQDQGAEASLIKLSLAESGYQDFRRAFDAIERRPAKVLLIDADFLVFEPDVFRGLGEPVRLDWRKDLRQRLRVALGVDPLIDPGPYEFNYEHTDGRPFCTFPTWGLSKDLQQYAAALADRRVSTRRERAGLLKRIAALQGAGVTVALFQTPRSPLTVGYFPAALDRAAATILRDEARAHGLAVIGPGPALPAEDFADGGHLNDNGRALYSQWLTAQTAQLLKARP